MATRALDLPSATAATAAGDPMVAPRLGKVPLRALHGPIRWPEVDDPAGPLMVDRDGRILAHHAALRRMLTTSPTSSSVPALQADPIEIAVVLLRHLYGAPASLLGCAHVVDDVLTEIGAGRGHKPISPRSLLTMAGARTATGRGSLPDAHVASVLRLGRAVAARAGSDGTWALRTLSDVHRALSSEARCAIAHNGARAATLGLWHLAAIARAPRDRQADLVVRAVARGLTVRQLRAAAACTIGAR